MGICIKCGKYWTVDHDSCEEAAEISVSAVGAVQPSGEAEKIVVPDKAA